MYIELSNLTYNFDGGKNNFKFANSLFKTPSEVIHTERLREELKKRGLYLKWLLNLSLKLLIS